LAGDQAAPSFAGADRQDRTKRSSKKPMLQRLDARWTPAHAPPGGRVCITVMVMGDRTLRLECAARAAHQPFGMDSPNL
jgi:hypothetical protein